VVNQIQTILASPFANAKTLFIVAPAHSRSEWYGPFDTVEEAQRFAAQRLSETGWLSCSVFKLVGTIAKPAPELQWHEAKEKSE
jgi:hypothetical protein